MTREKAIDRACTLYRKDGIERYVVFEPDECGEPAYHVCRDEDLDGFYMGCEPVFCSSQVHEV
jgi:hypothetical protein